MTYDPTAQNIDSNDNQKQHVCSSCRNIYSTYQALHAHYTKDVIRNTLYHIDKLTPIEFENNTCNTSWANAEELAKTS